MSTSKKKAAGAPTSAGFSKLQTAVRLMTALPDEKGREVHRRKYLIDFLGHLGFPEPLNDVGQKKKRPDLRYYSRAIENPTNKLPCSFLVETKDVGEISSIDSLPYRQMCRYVNRNFKRLVSIAVTDFKLWYRFDFDANTQAYYTLLNFARIADSSDDEWANAGAEDQARQHFEPFLVGAPFQFNRLGGKATATLQAEIRAQFDKNVLERSAPIVDVAEARKDQDSVETIAENLGQLMAPLVTAALAVCKDLSVGTKGRSRFKMWLKQKNLILGSVDTFLSKDRNPKEEELYEECCEEFAWLSAYSILNILYFVKGLEERKLFAPILSSKDLQSSPASFFPDLWSAVDAGKATFVTDFLRIQKVYCDWLIPKLPQGQLGEVIRYFSGQNLLTINKPDLLGRLYEQLMQNLDTESRKRLGQYYTPKPIAELLWQLTWRSLKKNKVQPQEVTTLDPASGSGMLLCRGVELLFEQMAPEPKNVGLSARDLASRSINGFEINPLSAAIARINLYYTYIDEITKRGGNAESTFVRKVAVSEIPIFNTDAYKLSEAVSDDLLKMAEIEGEDLEALKREAVFLKWTKDRSDFMLIIGNPPYCGSDESVADGKANHLRVWSNQYTSRKPNSGIREAFLHFLGMADLILSRGRRGMIAFVTSDSWLDNYDHEIVRRHFLRHYDPTGIVLLGPGMFPGLKVSTCLVMLEIRDQSISDQQVSAVDVPIASLSIDQTPEFRFKEIDDVLSGNSNLNWKHVKPDKHACLRYPRPEDLHFGLGFHELDQLFHVSFPACETGADPFLTGSNLEQLRIKVKKILGTDSPVEADISIAGKNNGSKLTKLRKIRDAENVEYDTQAFKPYLKFSGERDRYGVPEDRHHWIYFEPALLHRSIMQAKATPKDELVFNPHEAGTKLAFNSHELPNRCTVFSEKHYVHRWQHMRFAPLNIPEWLIDKRSMSTKSVSNLTAIGNALAKHFKSEEDFFYFLSGWINSSTIANGFRCRAKTEAPPIPDLSKLTASGKKHCQSISELAKQLAALEVLRPSWDQKSKNTELLIARLAKLCTIEGSKKMEPEEAFATGVKEINRLSQRIYEAVYERSRAA